MLSLLRTRRRQERKAPNNPKESLVYRMVLRCLKLQMKGAYFLQRKSERLSLRVKSSLLVLFCFLAGGASIYIAMKSLFSPEKEVLSIPAIQVPEYIGKAGEERKKGTIIISKAEIYRIQQFKTYMDSLGQTREGKRLKDSILRFRPGLMDSLHAIENLFESQTLKSK